MTLKRLLWLLGFTCGWILMSQSSAQAHEGAVLPVQDAPVTSEFGMRLHPVHKVHRLHDGVDYGAPCGTPIRAALSGVVSQTSNDVSGYGLLTKIRHNDGSQTFYAHQSKILVSVGQQVGTGEKIGLVGTTGTSTGCHLHFGAKTPSGEKLNPSIWLSGRKADGAAPMKLVADTQPVQAHEVAPGETLSGIASDHSLAEWQPIYELNRGQISDPDLIIPGQALKIPAVSQEKPASSEKAAEPAPTAVVSAPLDATAQDQIRHWFAHYGADVETGLRVADCESGFDVSAVNTGYTAADGSHPTGVFQFIRSTYLAMAAGAGLPEADDRLVPERNIQAAAWAFANGHGGHWACK